MKACNNVSSAKYVNFQTFESHRNEIERDMAKKFGMELYTSEEGFTQAELYNYAGRKDNVCTLTLRKGSISEKKYGSCVTCVFDYLLKERKALENNDSNLNSHPNIKAKSLDSKLDSSQVEELRNMGVATKDIIELIVSSPTSENNTFYSAELRTPNILSIPFEAKGNGDDIGYIYGALCRFKEFGIGLMPEEESQYLAYKLILTPEQLTEEEHSTIFNEKNAICNQDVAYFYLLWKKTANKIDEKGIKYLNIIKENHFFDRIELVETELDKMGLSLKKLSKKYPTHALLLLKKILEFRDKRFNMVGKYPLYMNFESMLHIYLRHVRDLEVKEQFGDRDKFQLTEEDIDPVISIVMKAINIEYQEFKKLHPHKRFYLAGKKAYYYNGDYYNVYVDAEGRVETFYKGSGRQST